MTYHGTRKVEITTTSKMVIAVIITFQMMELVCYLILFRYITDHNMEMHRNIVISDDLLKSRRRINIFSLNAQVVGFAIEATFFVLNLSLKAIGRKYFPPNTQEYSNIALVLLFCVNSTVPILASSELRKKFLVMFSR